MSGGLRPVYPSYEELDRWMSGLNQRFAKPYYGNVEWVRFPHDPPILVKALSPMFDLDTKQIGRNARHQVQCVRICKIVVYFTV